MQGPFSGEEGNVLRWLSGAGLAICLAAAGLIVAALLRPAAKTPASVRWMLFFGLFALPATAAVLGTAVGFTRVKDSCSECHTMEPWNRDLRDPKSETLAARHFRNRWVNEHACYTCHTGYGFAGNVEAKLSGLSHVWHEYVAGAPAEIKIHKPFPASTCLHCHGGTPKYEKIDPHMDPEMRPKIESGEMTCWTCHAPPHPRKSP